MGVLSDSLFLFVLFKYGFGDKFENNISGKTVKEDGQHIWAVSSHSAMYGFDNHFLKK